MRYIAFLTIFSLPCLLFAIEINVAPILHVDETSETNRGNSRVQSDLLEALQRIETGVVLRFSGLRDNRINPPQSVTDAVNVSRNEQINYLLYGYVTRRSHSIQMEIRLFDYENRSVLQSFFSMDDSGNYERLLDDMARKIIIYMGNTLNLELIPEREQNMQLLIPITLGYWTPVQSEWVDVMFGTFRAASGIVFIPSDNLFTFWGFSWYLSTGLDIKYRLGVGNPSNYEAYSSTIYFTIPASINAYLTMRHEAFFGLGFVYFLELFSMADKYNESQNYVFNNVGLNVNFGYRFNINEKVSVFFRNDFDFLFNENSLITYSPAIGVNIQVYKTEARNRW